jgi:Ca-activated chloride channel family protein
VLTDLRLDFGSLSTYDMYPDPLPDLFAGSQIIAVGRYRQGGTTDVTLMGEFNNEARSFSYPGQVFATQSDFSDQLSAIPRLWATRKVGYLLNQIRLYGADQETIDQIVRLSIRYGIVTPYTSYLVTETAGMPLGEAEQQRIAEEQYAESVSQPTAAPSGAGAVQKAADQGALEGADSAAPMMAGAAEVVRIVGARTFVLSYGAWVDTTFDPDSMQTVKVSFLSDDYFALSAASPDIAAAFALGERVIVLWDGQAYEVVADGEPSDPIVVPSPLPVEPMATPEPAIETTPVVEPTPGGGNTTQPAAPCGAGLLVLLPLGGMVIFRRRRVNL